MLFAASSETNCSIFGSRLEKLNWRSNSSLAKCLGTIVSITGAFVVTFYKGPPILMTLTSPIHPLLSSPQLNWIFGGLLLVAEALMISAWYIAQVRFISILLKTQTKKQHNKLIFSPKIFGIFAGAGSQEVSRNTYHNVLPHFLQCHSEWSLFSDYG